MSLAYPPAPLEDTGSRFRYADPDLSAHGVSRIVLGKGLQDGKATVMVGGKGSGLDLPILPIAPAALPLVVQHQAEQR